MVFPMPLTRRRSLTRRNIVSQMKETGMEIQTKCNLVKSSFGILVFSSNVERESFLRKKWARDEAMVEEKFEDKTLRYSRPSTKEDRHIGRCLAKAKRAMCELEMPATYYGILPGSGCRARRDICHIHSYYRYMHTYVTHIHTYIHTDRQTDKQTYHFVFFGSPLVWQGRGHHIVTSHFLSGACLGRLWLLA